MFFLILVNSLKNSPNLASQAIFSYKNFVKNHFNYWCI